MSLRQDPDAAASTVVAFLMAGVIFVGSVGAILAVSNDAGSSKQADSAQAAERSIQAQVLADILLASPGYTQLTANGEPVAWDGALATSGSQSLLRLGLRDPASDQMSFTKFQNLRRAGAEASATDGAVNYPEALESLDLAGTGVDFHIRAFPALASVREILATGNRDPNLRVAYVADVEARYSGGGTAFSIANPAHVGTPTCTVGSNLYTISVPVTNPGSTTTLLSGFFTVKMGSSTFADRTRSVLLAPGDSDTLTLEVPSKAGRSCTGATLGLEVWDPNSRLDKTTTGHPLTLSGTGTAATTVANDLWLNPGRTYYNHVVGSPVVVDFEGDLPTSKTGSVTLGLSITNPSGTTTAVTGLPAVTKSVRSFSVPASFFPAAGTYIASLSYPGGVTVHDRIIVLNTGVTPAVYTPGTSTVSYVPSPPVALEASYLDTLVENFCGYYFDTSAYAAADSPMAAAPGSARCTSQDRRSNPDNGDIYPDTRDTLNRDLRDRLLNAADTGYEQRCNGHITGGPRYDWTRVLIIGSNVDHNSMTSADAKYAVCEWVMGGGTLIVFGSADQQVQWLQPIFHAAIVSSNNGISTPDQSHPILNRADVLAYSSYDPRGKSWSFNGQTAQNQDELLTNVVVSGTTDSILSVSNPGAFGDGTVILTTWLPYDLFGTGAGTSDDEALRVINNFLMQGYRDLFLDYGPRIPVESRQASAAQRVVEIQHPEFDEPVTLTVFVYVF